VTAFVAADDYGAVYPYLGERGANQYSWQGKNTMYGFADAAGEIICDPVYNSVTVVRNGDEFVYVAAQNSFAAGTNQNYDSTDGVSTVTVIGADGKFCGTYDAVCGKNIIYKFEYEYIPVEKDGKWGAIDFSGNEILPCVYANAPLFSEGLAAVFNDDGITYRYIDASGETVMAGPFEAPPRLSVMGVFGLSFYDANLESAAFHSGLAMNFKDGRYGYIDASGALVIPRNFSLCRNSQIGWNEKGLAVACVSAMTSDEILQGGYRTLDFIFELIDTAGEVRARYAVQGYSGDFSLDASGKYYIGSGASETDLAMTVFDLNGEVAAENSAPSGLWLNFADGYWVMQNNNYIIQIIGNGVSRELGNYFTVLWRFGDVFYIFGYYPGDDSGKSRSWLYNAQTGENILNGRDLGPDYTANPPGLNVRRENLDDGRGNYKQLYGMLDDGGNVLLDFNYDVLQCVDPTLGKFYAAQGNYGGLLNDDGSWFIKAPLDGNYD